MSESAMKVTFWGVRGTLPTTGAQTLRYGGQTSCVEVRCGDHTLIFDAGTGIYPLGETLAAGEIDLFLSHTHIDHILGFPFFSPAYNKDFTIRVWAGHLASQGHTLRETLARLMSPPPFPLTLDFLSAQMSYHDFSAGEKILSTTLLNAGIEILTLPLNHPDAATAYRVNYRGASVCYVTDVEHRSETLDSALLGFIKDADLFIYDSTFDDKDFDHYAGWGHSTWQHGMRLAEAARVKSLALFHHDPASNDDLLDNRLALLQQQRPNDIIAREGLIVTL